MTKTTKDQVAAPKMNVYEAEELEISTMLLEALHGSKELDDAVKMAVESKERHERLKSEVVQLRADKADIEGKIEALKKDFGADDSFQDVQKLKMLNIELDAIDTAIPIIENQLRFDSGVVRGVQDTKDDVAHQIHLTTSKFKDLLQEKMDQKVNDILLSFDTYEKTFARVRQELDQVPNEFIPFDIFNHIRPNAKALEKVVVDPFHEVALAVSVRNNLLKEMNNAGTGNTGATNVVHVNQQRPAMRGVSMQSQ